MGWLVRVYTGAFAFLLTFVTNGASSSSSTAVFDRKSALESHQLYDRSNTYTFRLLPVGDSITNGYKSSDGNGYRLDLEKLLQEAGDTVDFIGSNSNGENNPDDQNEGFDGYRIDQILAQIETDGILRQRPNLVLIHAGTNDNDAQTAETDPDPVTRLGNLIDAVLCQCPDAVVLIAKVIQNAHHQWQANIFNAQVPNIVNERYNQGFKVRVVDQSNIGRFLLSDGLHPNDAGYSVMAQNWMDAINSLPEGWVTPPIDTAATGAGTTSVGSCVASATYWTSTSTSAGADSSSIPSTQSNLATLTVAVHTSVHPTSTNIVTPAASTASATPSTTRSGANHGAAFRSSAGAVSLAVVALAVLEYIGNI